MNKTLIAIALSFFLAAGCQQGLGERCQVNADCASNLCLGSDPNVPKVCATSGDDNDQNPIDAEVPVPMDAPEAVDAADASVAVDGAIDAP
jgi:hypothetical protein